jgi:hypothetical protein
MPWLTMYLIDRDVKTLCAMLHDDPDIALIRGDGPGRWKAQRDIPALADGEHGLWHIPSGPIALESRIPKSPPKLVKDPFRGWKEIVKPSNPKVPWISTAPLGVIWLRVRRKAGRGTSTYSPYTDPSWSAPANEVIGMSTFNWIGSYYSIIGQKPAKSTQLWWQSLRRRVAKIAQQIPSTGRLTGKDKEVWAFPAALEQIKRGARRADQPFH